MQGVPEFQTAAELRAHYAALLRRKSRPPTIAKTIVQERPQSGERKMSPITSAIFTLIEASGVGDQKISRFMVMEAVMMVSGLKKVEFISSCRMTSYVRARQVYFYLCKKHTSASYPEIGRPVKGRDHSTLMHGVRKVKEDLEAGGTKYNKMIEQTETLLRSWLQAIELSRPA